jgi:cytochrome c-type biogenesis protein CcmH
MNLWLLMTMLCSAAAVGISIPLIRRLDNINHGRARDTAIYEDQLKEVERDLQGGAINRPEAESAKLEIQRRLNAASKNLTAARPVSPAWRGIALVASTGLVILGSVSLYNIMGSPNLPSVSPQPQAATPAEQQTQASSTVAGAPTSATGPGQIDAMVTKLTARLQANPKDAEGWRMLGWSQFNLQHYLESSEAYAKALALDPTNAEYKSAYAEVLVQTAQGIVTPKAKALIADVLAKEPKDPRARFYDALGHEQSGDQTGALDRWLDLLANTPVDASWRNDVKQRIADLAKVTGRDVSSALAVPSLPTSASQQTMARPEKDAMVDGLESIAQGSAAVTPAPQDSSIPPSASAPMITDEQKAAVQAMPESDQKTMIKGMVERLATKLADNPNDLDGWIRLMRSYQVMNEPAKAKEAVAKAISIFANDSVNSGKIKAAASELGIN